MGAIGYESPGWGWGSLKNTAQAEVFYGHFPPWVLVADGGTGNGDDDGDGTKKIKLGNWVDGKEMGWKKVGNPNEGKGGREGESNEDK
jgi:hypothetical protein